MNTPAQEPSAGLTEFLAYGDRVQKGSQLVAYGVQGPFLWDVRLSLRGNYWVRISLPSRAIPAVHFPYWQLFVGARLGPRLSLRMTCVRDYIIHGEYWGWAEAVLEREPSAEAAEEAVLLWVRDLTQALQPSEAR